MQAGGGAGVLQPKIHNAYLQRTGQMPFYRPAQSQAWMGTGSRAAWHAEMARQSNEYLGVVAAPIGLLGGAAKSVYDVAEFSLKAGKTLLGTSAYLHTLGAIGGEDFAATSNLLKGAGNFAWNSAGNYVYTLSGGALAQQEHAAYMGYVGAVAGAASNLWDGTYGAWSRGDYLSAGETVGGIVGIPLPLAKVGYFGKFRALDNVVASTGGGFVRFASDYDSHVLLRDFSVPSKRGIGGAHNLDEFMKYSNEFRVVDTINHPAMDGISTIKYQMAARDKAGVLTNTFRDKIFDKTVFDPKIIAPEDFLSWGRQAAAQGQSLGPLNRVWTGTAPNGLHFMGYLDDQGAVRSFFPDF
ncbi:hypothetical protein CNO08_06630 [Lysobacter capsici]|nr:hypothetical protein CNO08_06630 [Lysobacter capsici]